MDDLFIRFSSKENLQQAYRYVQNELKRSSLAVNPINHSSLTAIDDFGEQFFIALQDNLRSGHYTPEKGFYIYLPKDDYGLRPICALSLIDRIVYQAFFNPEILGYQIDGQLSDEFCLGNRLNEDRQSEYFLTQYKEGWNIFCKKQKSAFDENHTWKLELDLQQFFENIPAYRLIEVLRKEFGVRDEKILALLQKQLITWAEQEDLATGLPQGPAASALLSNAYLSGVDKYVEKNIVSDKIRYLRYADDIVLQGATKEAVRKATESLVRFLRQKNLRPNEKTKLAQLEDKSTIEALQLGCDYDDTPTEIPEDEQSELENRVPYTINSILEGDRVERKALSELKYYLSVCVNYDTDFALQLIQVLAIKPSLTIHIIRFIDSVLEKEAYFGPSEGSKTIEFALWETYESFEVPEWTKFWIFKLLISNKETSLDFLLSFGVQQFLSDDSQPIFKILALYYKAIHQEEIKIEMVSTIIESSKNNFEKSIFSFFLLNALQGVRHSIAQNNIQSLLSSPSHDLNLIGCYLLRKNPTVQPSGQLGYFSSQILGLPLDIKHELQTNQIAQSIPEGKLFYIREDSLIPVPNPSELLGVKRTTYKKKSCLPVDLTALSDNPEWEKLELRFKEGLNEIEIRYDNKFVQNADYIDLGFFRGSKNKAKDRCWGMLGALAMIASKDKTLATINALQTAIPALDANVQKISPDNVQRTKHSLTGRLQSIFGINDDPFHPYTKLGYYNLKFTLLPEPSLRHEEIFTQGGRYNDEYHQGDVGLIEDIPF